jgi:aminopeptidase N
MRAMSNTCRHGIALGAVLTLGASQSELSSRAPDPPPHVLHYRIRLDLFPESHSIQGSVTATIRFAMADRMLSIDVAPELVVDSVFVGGQKFTPTHGAGQIQFAVPPRADSAAIFTVTTFYHGQPSSGLLFKSVGTSTVVASYGLPYSARRWWPCMDSPSRKADSADIEITVPDSLVVASNGVLRSRDPHGSGTVTYRWAVHYPIYPDVISLAVANYDTFTLYAPLTRGDSLPLSFFVYPRDLSKARTDFSVLPEIMPVYERLFGPYPFAREKYGVAEFPIGSFREHQTLPSYGSSFITGDHRNDWILAHELAHQWFGNSLSVASWSDAWLNEGLATYAAALWREASGGKRAYAATMGKFRKGDLHGSLYVPDSLDVKDMFSDVTFQKGAWVLHMLRHVMGDSAFFSGLRKYVAQHSYRNVTTNEFRQAMETAAGEDLKWFFEEWVYGAALPQYELRQERQGSAMSQRVSIRQIQTLGPAFRMPLDLLVHRSAGDTLIVVIDSLRHQEFTISRVGTEGTIVLDPGSWVLTGP